MDPLAEKYPNYSSYVYCYNNPVKFIDPDGRAGIAGPAASYWMSNMSPEQMQETGKTGLRLFTPIEDIYSVFFGKDFDGEKVHRGAAFAWAMLAIVPEAKFAKLSSKYLKVSEYGFKHIASVKTAWKDVVKSTINGPSKFIHELNYEKITKEAWDNGTKVSNGKTWKVFKAENVIGASSGKETEFMRVELTGQTKELHSSPITKEEYQRLTKKEQ